VKNIESQVIQFTAKIVPWLAPLPSCYLVSRAAVVHLEWPLPVALAAGVVIEALGLSTSETALSLYEFNKTKRKVDASAPFLLAASLVLVYIFSVTGLTILLDLRPEASIYAPIIFPALSLCGMLTLALRTDHQNRLKAIAEERAARREERKAHRLTKKQVEIEQQLASNSIQSNTPSVQSNRLDKTHETLKAKANARLDALLDTLAGNPEMTVTEAARLLNCSRQTVYSSIEALTTAGRLHKNGNGWEVIDK